MKSEPIELSCRRATLLFAHNFGEPGRFNALQFLARERHSGKPAEGNALSAIKTYRQSQASSALQFASFVVTQLEPRGKRIWLIETPSSGHEVHGIVEAISKALVGLDAEAIMLAPSPAYLEKVGTASAGAGDDKGALRKQLRLNKSIEVRTEDVVVIVDDVFATGDTVCAIVDEVGIRAGNLFVAAPLRASPRFPEQAQAGDPSVASAEDTPF